MNRTCGWRRSVRRYQPVFEALALLAVTLPLAVGLHLPTLWLVTPVAVISFTKRSYATYGLSLQRPGSLWFHLAVILAVFVPYTVGHYAFAHWWFGATFRFRMPSDFAASALDQLVIIALPEEIFFRGYLQTEFDRALGKPYRFLGAKWGIGLATAAALFAACHMIHGGPVRLIVFFPALLYGWLRARTGTIAVPAVYHAASNLLMEIMLASLVPHS
jgi:membrane protease YdiL (CAAX protease family)